MVLYLLQLEATLVNCTNLQLENGFDHPSHHYHFELVCERRSCRRKVKANVAYDTWVPFPLNEDDDSDSFEEYNSDSSFDEDEYEAEKLERKELINILRKNIPNVHFSHSCECGNIMWVIMKLGYGSPLKVPKQDDETPDIDPGISYEPGLTTTMVAFDIAGAEPINYQMGGGWRVDMVGGSVSRTFQGVDLSDVHVNLQNGEEAKLERPMLIMFPKASFLLFEN